jgi:hypothetical protein
MGDRSHIANVLRQKGVGDVSRAMPPEIGRYRLGVPSADSLIPVPDMEEFPLDEPTPAPQLTPGESRAQFCQFQVQHIANDVAVARVSGPELDCRGPTLEIPTEFDSVDDFIAFKRALATVFKLRSDEYGWHIPMGVCEFPSCLNSAPPTFHYCLYHLPLDPEFTNQKFLTTCQALVDGRPCGTPCGIGSTKCAFHRALGKDSSSK